jgi:ATP-dependent Clp protease ATP-binding subunit ClpA
MAQHESTCVQEMETALRQRVFGQDEAIATVSRSLCRQTTSHRPLGSFLFFGSPGVGKGTFAQVLAEYMFGSAEACISMGAWKFMDSPNAQRFGSVLIEAVQQQPAAVICLEEIEKGHPLIFDVLMQILAEG